jgi:hypothetical protein
MPVPHGPMLLGFRNAPEVRFCALMLFSLSNILFLRKLSITNFQIFAKFQPQSIPLQNFHSQNNFFCPKIECHVVQKIVYKNIESDNMMCKTMSQHYFFLLAGFLALPPFVVSKLHGPRRFYRADPARGSTTVCMSGSGIIGVTSARFKDCVLWFSPCRAKVSFMRPISSNAL